MKNSLPIIAVVTQTTRLAGLKSRWVTSKAAAFRIQHAAVHEVERRRKRAFHAGKSKEFDEQAVALAVDALYDQDEYFDEHQIYESAIETLLDEIDLGYPIKEIDRGFVTNFDFGRCVAVVVIGRDGLVANTAKYVGDLPIIGVNPDPTRNDGVLLPYTIEQARTAVQRVLKNRATFKTVTLAEVNTNDGQRMLAFNDFYVGAKTHVSARYSLEYADEIEAQSSSGIIIATGAGSTGWLSSVFNMNRGINRALNIDAEGRIQMEWDDRRLFWAVREPFVSRHSSAEYVAGYLDTEKELVVGSQMTGNGVIFSDGIESDFIEFNAGTIARFFPSTQRANLVVG